MQIREIVTTQKKKRKICELHGKGIHSTANCNMIKIMEAKGWSHKDKIVEMARTINRPFVIVGSIDGIKREMLIDTGAAYK